MSLKVGARGQDLHSSALSPPRPMLGPLRDQRGGPYVTLYCTAFILLGFWGRDVSWLFPALPAHSPFRPAPQGLLCLCLATGSTGSGISSCQIQLFERPFFLLLPKQQSGRVERLTTPAESLLDYCMQQMYSHPNPMSSSIPTFLKPVLKNHTCYVD